jgi:hypothetical protein
MPMDALTRLIGYLDYLSLKMLRTTSKFFYQLPAEHLIHEIFLELKMDEIALDDLIDWNDDFPCACSVCHCFVGPESDTSEQTGKALKICKCGRKHYNIRRPGVLVYGECESSHCEKCGDGDEICGPMLLCKPCWGGGDRTDAGKKKKRRQFCARYGHWLRLVWRSGRAKYDHTKTWDYRLSQMRQELQPPLPKFPLEPDTVKAMIERATKSREAKEVTMTTEGTLAVPSEGDS